jgi:hypothetical protein
MNHKNGPKVSVNSVGVSSYHIIQYRAGNPLTSGAMKSNEPQNDVVLLPGGISTFETIKSTSLICPSSPSKMSYRFRFLYSKFLS